MKSKNKFKNIKENEIWNAENIYHLKTNISRIGKLIYHYEIYKKIKSIPGDVIELGVFKGISLIRFLTFRSLVENSFSRKIIGFDTFGKFPVSRNLEDQRFIKRHLPKAGNAISVEELDNILFEKKFENYQLIKGNILKTLPTYINNNRDNKIALLHLDMDIYEPTKFALEKLFKKMSPNGIILIDDYSTVEGATKAVDEFLNKNKKLKLNKLKYYKQPSFIEVKK